MKLVMFLLLSTFLVSCASTGRHLAASDEKGLYQSEERHDFGPGFTH